MNPHESTAFLRSDEDDHDFLRDKPMGRCPWCRQELFTGGKHPSAVALHCFKYDDDSTELENRARYAAQREADAHTEERISREARRSGHEPPY